MIQKKKGANKSGYIIFIDYDYDIDYVDLRDNNKMPLKYLVQ